MYEDEVFDCFVEFFLKCRKKTICFFFFLDKEVRNSLVRIERVNINCWWTN